MRGCRGATGCAVTVLVVIAAFVVAVFVWIIPSARKEYSIDTVAIAARVRATGALTVSERFSYTFHGDFTRVFRDIPIDPDSPITVLGVDGPGGSLRRLPSGWVPAMGSPTPVPAADDATPSPWMSLAPEQRPFGFYRVTQGVDGVGLPVVRIEAFADLSDRSATFTFHWRAVNAAARWADAGEFWWKLIGSGWDVPMGHVRAVVSLPKPVPKRQVRAWGHGPLNGVVRIRRDGTVVLTVDQLAANTYVEVHELFPPSLLSGMEPVPADMRETRVQQETEWARAANEQRALARDRLAAERRNERIAWVVFGIVTGLAVLVWFTLFFRGGREYRPTFRARYVRDIPTDMPPALVGALWRMGKLNNDDISATLLDLAVKGVLRIEPVEGSGEGLADAEAGGKRAG